MMESRGWIVIACLTLTSRAAWAQPAPDPDDTPRGDDKVTLLGTAEIELVDVTGPGGFANRMPGITQPRRRAPYADLDKATLDARFQVTSRIAARLELRADRSAAKIDRLYLDAVALDGPRWDVLVQAGHQKPMERPPERRVETYSPLGAVFWRGREWHAGAHATFQHERLTVDVIGSAAMQRPLGSEAMGEDQGLPSIAFTNSAPLEDTVAEVGGLLGVGARGLHAAVFGFRGALLDRQGTARLADTFPDDYKEQFFEIGDRTSRWLGARAWYDARGVHALAEGITQTLGQVRRRGFEVGASYTLAVTTDGRRIEIEPFLRYGQLTITNLPERYLISESWDREQYVTAVLVRPAPALELKLEYLFLRERTGLSAEETRGVSDDQVLLQLRLEQDLL